MEGDLKDAQLSVWLDKSAFNAVCTELEFVEVEVGCWDKQLEDAEVHAGMQQVMIVKQEMHLLEVQQERDDTVQLWRETEAMLGMTQKELRSSRREAEMKSMVRPQASL